MKQVMVHPQRCVGCMQCMTSCAVAHSRTGSLFSAVCEIPQPKPRIHVGEGLFAEGFPNRCRHCDPAPCMAACLPGAISRIPGTRTVSIDPDLCINCASCAMTCPFGVIRYHEDRNAPPGKIVAVKCDNCHDRQMSGGIPACVEACKSGALTFEEPDEAMRRTSTAVARSMSAHTETTSMPPGVSLLNRIKKSQIDMQNT